MDSTIVILSDEEKDTITSHSHSSQEMSTDWIERALANHFGVIPTIIDVRHHLSLFYL